MSITSVSTISSSVYIYLSSLYCRGDAFCQRTESLIPKSVGTFYSERGFSNLIKVFPNSKI